VSVQHVTLTVPDPRLVPHVERFLRLLGGVDLIRPPALVADTPGCWMGFGEGTQVHVVPGSPPAPEAHFALHLGDRYDGVLEALRAASVPVRMARDLWGGRRSFVRDPAGNLIELFDIPPPSRPAG
jgi:catechol 2,3-dioxygenase-like lactoylglutathione lyase family enzyme